MKSFVKSSRFVQPRRVENSAPSSSSSRKAPEEDAISPTTVLLNSNNSGGPENISSIEDFVSNLEQQVHDSSSIGKWDELRKTEEREHALMRGDHAGAATTITPMRNAASDAIRKEKPATMSNDNHPSSPEESGHRSLDQNVVIERKRRIEPMHEALLFSTWILLLIAALKVSAFLRAAESNE